VNRLRTEGMATMAAATEEMTSPVKTLTDAPLSFSTETRAVGERSGRAERHEVSVPAAGRRRHAR